MGSYPEAEAPEVGRLATGSARNRSLADSRWSIRRIQRCMCHTKRSIKPSTSRARNVAPGSCDGAAVQTGESAPAKDGRPSPHHQLRFGRRIHAVQAVSVGY